MTIIRASSLDMLVTCELFWYLENMTPFERASGKAAHNGTAVHRAIQLWHQGTPVDAALAQVARECAGGPNRDPFDLYEDALVRRWLIAYAGDPRNRRRVVASELEVKVTLPAHEWDPTGEPITIVGHLDELADAGSYRELWDYKSGSVAGCDMASAYAFQLSAYLLGAQDTEHAPVRMGGIIRVRDYTGRKKPPQVFYRLPITVQDARDLLDGLRLKIAAARAGQPQITPGRQCYYCPLRSVTGCLHYARTGKMP